MSKKIKPKEEVPFDFRSAVMVNWAEEANGISGRNYSDDVTVPEMATDKTASLDTLYFAAGKSPGVAEWWPTGFVTYPSPALGFGTASTPGFRGPVSFHPDWQSPDTREASPHDQWLEASYSTTSEDSWPNQIIFNSDKLVDSGFPSNRHFGSFSDQSLGGVIYESLEGASGVCWPFYNDYFDDYIDDVLSVMAKEANNNSHSIYELA